MFCERCGQNFLPRQSTCTRCRVPATRHWLQLMSLTTLLLAVGGNSLVAWFLLPQRLATRPRLFFRIWMWLDVKTALYGWAPLVVALLAWDYLVWRRSSRPKIKGWVTCKLLTFTLLAGIAPAIPWWVPAGQPPKTFLAAVGQYPGLPSILAWAVVLFVVALLCINSETRDPLLGDGRVLSLVSLGILVFLLAMTVVGWSLT